MVKTMVMPNDVVKNGTVLKWMKKEGEKFEKGEPLFEVETPKTVVQVDAPESGTILRINAKEGTAVIAGSEVAHYAVEGEKVPPELLKPPAPAILFVKLLDDGNNLVTDASVSVDGDELVLTVDGEFTINGLAPAGYTIRVKAPGFLEKLLILKLGEGETARHELNLQPIAKLKNRQKNRDSIQ